MAPEAVAKVDKACTGIVYYIRAHLERHFQHPQDMMFPAQRCLTPFVGLKAPVKNQTYPARTYGFEKWQSTYVQDDTSRSIKFTFLPKRMFRLEQECRVQDAQSGSWDWAKTTLTGEYLFGQ